MTLKSDIDQLAADAVLMHQVVHGDSAATITTADGPVRSVAKLISDKNAEINQAAGGVLAQSIAQANAAANSASGLSTAVQQAQQAAGTANQYSTALAAIASQTAIVPAATVTGFNGVVIASCIYDTRTDSDGGAWRKRCQHTSWYNEVTTATGKNLGALASLAAALAVPGVAVGDHYYDTTTKLFYSIIGAAGALTREVIFRGPRKEFPEVVGITAEAGRVVIWDLTDRSVPMWMVIPASALNGWWYTARACSCISIMNGMLLIGTNTPEHAGSNGVKLLNFISDSLRHYSNPGVVQGYSSAAYGVVINRLISIALPAVFVNVVLVNALVNSIAVTVLPNAPINSATGLPVPTIAVGTAGGVSVIKDDGTVVNSVDVVSKSHVSIDSDNNLWAIQQTVVNQNYGYVGRLTAGFTYLMRLIGNGPDYYPGYLPYPGAGNGSGKNILTTTGLVRVKGGGYLTANHMIAAISNAYNSGWMLGDIRGAWLADTVAETVNGAALITGDSATFTTGVGKWVPVSGATLAAVGGRLEVTQGVSGSYGGAAYPFETVVGKTYKVAWDSIAGTAPAIQVFQISGVNNINGVPGSGFVVQFTATSTSHSLLAALASSSAVGQTIYYDNISIIECAADRSVKAKPLAVIGTLTKNAVNTGSQLVAYSGFSAANYLERSYSAQLDFGTGDFSVMCWFYPLSGMNYSALFARGLDSGSGSFGGNGFFAYNDDGVASNIVVGTHVGAAKVTVPLTGIVLASWNLLMIKRVSGVLSASLNNGAVASVANTQNITGTSETLMIGRRQSSSNPNAFGNSSGKLALFRVSATAPSADQITYIYETERKLFEPGAQCCIVGTFSAVTALGDDDLTDILHVGTSWGVTEFQGLKAIKSQAQAGVTAISAKSGYELISGTAGSSFYKPSRLLAEELTRTFEQRRAFGSTPICKVFDSLPGQTDFTLGLKETPTELVYVAGVWQGMGATRIYTVLDDGFRKTLRFNIATPDAIGEVAIFYVKEL